MRSETRNAPRGRLSSRSRFTASPAGSPRWAITGIALFLLLPLEVGGQAPESRKPQTIDQILRGIDRWVVAIRVERSEDLGRSRFQPRDLPREAEGYFDRPEGYVTGLLVGRAGHVVTSYYNVGGEVESIEVRLADGSEHEADLLAVSKIDDLALLELQGEREFAENWEDPPLARAMPAAGRILLAVGRSPDPRHLTVTVGIVSATGRNGGRALQTDAKLNYGNVGGPILNLDGEIVAIAGFVGHTYAQWGLNSGIGFGTKVSVLEEILPQLEKGEDILPPEPAFLGVQSDPNATAVEGAPVASVLDGTAASRAGIQGGDIIVEVDGTRIAHFNHLRRLLYQRAVGDTIAMKVLRGEEEVELSVTLGTRPESQL